MIFVECNPDKFLVRQLIRGKQQQKKKRIRHGGGKSGVLDILEEGKGRIVGIVDEDPNRSMNPPKKRKDYVREAAKGSIKLLRKRDDSSKSLIELSPDLEGWLISRAKENGISLKKYGLPDDPKAMHDIPHIERDPDFQKFIKGLIRTSDDEVNALRTWIREAIE